MALKIVRPVVVPVTYKFTKPSIQWPESESEMHFMQKHTSAQSWYNDESNSYANHDEILAIMTIMEKTIIILTMRVILATKNNNENNDNGRDNHCAIDNDINFSSFTKLSIDTVVEKILTEYFDSPSSSSKPLSNKLGRIFHTHIYIYK